MHVVSTISNLVVRYRLTFSGKRTQPVLPLLRVHPILRREFVLLTVRPVEDLLLVNFWFSYRRKSFSPVFRYFIIKTSRLPSIMYSNVCMQLKFGERVKRAIKAFFRAHKHRWLIINFNVVFTCLTPFIRLNGSITLIRAETERYDIVRFSKVTTKSLASGTGS